MKLATGKGFRRLTESHVSLSVVSLFIFLSFFTHGSTAQPVAQETNQLPARNRQYFLVQLEKGSIRGKEETIRVAFLSNNFTSCEIVSADESLRLICEKGCFIDQVRAVLKELGLTMTTYREAYTNKTPAIFQ